MTHPSYHTMIRALPDMSPALSNTEVKWKNGHAARQHFPRCTSHPSDSRIHVLVDETSSSITSFHLGTTDDVIDSPANASIGGEILPNSSIGGKWTTDGFAYTANCYSLSALICLSIVFNEGFNKNTSRLSLFCCGRKSEVERRWGYQDVPPSAVNCFPTAPSLLSNGAAVDDFLSSLAGL